MQLFFKKRLLDLKGYKYREKEKERPSIHWYTPPMARAEPSRSQELEFRPGLPPESQTGK